MCGQGCRHSRLHSGAMMSACDVRLRWNSKPLWVDDCHAHNPRQSFTKRRSTSTPAHLEAQQELDGGAVAAQRLREGRVAADQVQQRSRQHLAIAAVHVIHMFQAMHTRHDRQQARRADHKPIQADTFDAFRNGMTAKKQNGSQQCWQRSTQMQKCEASNVTADGSSAVVLTRSEQITAGHPDRLQK